MANRNILPKRYQIAKIPEVPVDPVCPQHRPLTIQDIIKASMDNGVSFVLGLVPHLK